MSRDTADAIETIVLGPFYALAVGILFYVAFRIYALLRPGVTGPFTGAMDSLANALSVAYSLFQLASTLETIVAFVVVGLAVYSFFTMVFGGSGGYSRRR